MSPARRWLFAPLVLLLLALGAGFAATTASAAPCPYVGTCDPTIGVTVPTITAGSTQSFTIGGFAAGERVTLTFTDADGRITVETVIADAQGNATGSFLVPADSSGSVTLTATGQQGDTASTSFTVVGLGPTGSPTTGGPTSGGTGTGGNGSGGNGSGGNGSGGSSGSPSSSGGGLAYTGAAVGGIALLSLGLLVGGGVLLVLGRRRRPAAS